VPDPGHRLPNRRPSEPAWRDTLAGVAMFIAFVLFWIAVMVVGYHALVAGQPDPCAHAVGGQCIP